MRATISRTTLMRYLLPTSLAYLGLPSLIFILGWLKWSLAAPIAVLLVAATAFLVRDERRVSSGPGESAPVELPLFHVLLPVLVAFVLLLLSGVGGYGPQEGDWEKHNAILKDLMQKPWPVIYEYEGQTLPLVYYIAYYLPAGLVGKYAGWDAANQALFVWSLFGVVLVFLWFQLLVGRFAVGVSGIFLFFSGLDSLGSLIRFAVAGNWDWQRMTLEVGSWARNWIYVSRIDSLWWAPHMAIAGWILAALVLNSVWGRRCARNGLFYLGLSLPWSPFLSIGIGVYLAMGWLSERADLGKLRNYFSPPNLCGAVLIALYGFYFVAKFYPPLPPGGAPVHGWIFTAPLTPDWHWTRLALVMGLFCLLEFGVYAIVLASCGRAIDGRKGMILAVTVVWLTLLPLYRYGYYNDLAMRASIPALFVLSILVGKAFYGAQAFARGRSVLAILLLLGAIAPLISFTRHAVAMYEHKTIDFRPAMNDVGDLILLHQGVVQRTNWAGFIGQYTGSAEAPFFRYLARRNSPEGGKQ
jgi:hypothetical protein